jgi:hypothetical protein
MAYGIRRTEWHKAQSTQRPPKLSLTNEAFLDHRSFSEGGSEGGGHRGKS